MNEDIFIDDFKGDELTNKIHKENYTMNKVNPFQWLQMCLNTNKKG
jgi:hypothetical protein